MLSKPTVFGLATALCALSSPALAQDAAPVINSGDTAWILTATALVLFMTLPGLAMFYGGLVRAKNYLSVLMKVLSIAALASLVWIIAGYSIAFGGDGLWWGGLSKAFSNVGTESVNGTIPENVFLAFQMTFAIITPALIVGAFVERVKFLPVMIFTALWVLVVYAPVTHWIWGKRSARLISRAVWSFTRQRGFRRLFTWLCLARVKVFRRSYQSPTVPVW
jgi:Amt family ammonium transporter